MLFNNFPKVKYSIDKSNALVGSTDIIKRFSPVAEVLNRVGIYYDYEIKDKETPEIVAHKIYGNMDYHWIILMFNQYLDPYYSWPLSDEEFYEYLTDKYESYENSTQVIHHYEWIYQKQETMFDGSTIPEKTLEVNQATFNTLEAGDRRIVYNYDYEFNINEAKRRIKLIEGQYIPEILKEKERIFSV